MLEKIQQRLLDLKAAQDTNTPMRCPRCGANTMKQPMHTNALSRHQDLYICDSCGTAEAFLDFMGQTYPLYQWHAFAPQRPPSDFKARTAYDVLTETLQTQTEILNRIYTLCRDDPDNAMWYRNEAFESCAGLTELILEPFHAKYMCADGTVLVQFRTTKDGTVQMSASVVEK